MSRYLRGRLERLQGRIGEPSLSPHADEARARMVEHLASIAEARRTGIWTDEDAIRSSEAVRAEAIRRRGEG